MTHIIIKDNRLQSNTKLIMLYLTERQKDGQVEISKKEIAKDLNTARQTVIRSISELEKYGYIKQSRESVNKASLITIL